MCKRLSYTIKCLGTTLGQDCRSLRQEAKAAHTFETQVTSGTLVGAFSVVVGDLEKAVSMRALFSLCCTFKK